LLISKQERLILDEFISLSKEVVKRFLQTVMMVDDRAVFGEEVEEPIPTLLKTPYFGSQIDDLQENSNRSRETDTQNVIDNVSNTELLETRSHILNAKKVIDKFASEGIICSVLKPDEHENPVENVISAAKRTDVLVLDWQIYNDNGHTAREIIKEIMDSDSLEKGRLRLILIYTGDRDKLDAFKKISEQFQNLKSDEERFTLRKDYFQITIILKTDCPVDNLPDEIYSEFSEMTAGIVSNVALESLAVLRDNTQLILGELGPSMDPPYLSHRALLPHPDDATRHIVDIIAAEFHSILENHEVGNLANLDVIKAWLNLKNSTGDYKIQHYDSEEKKERETSIKFQEITKLLDYGFDNVRKDIKYDITVKGGKRKKHIEPISFKNLTNSFCFNSESPDVLDCRFAIRTSQKNHYGWLENKPKLTLGTILKGPLKESAKHLEEGAEFLEEATKFLEEAAIPLEEATKRLEEATMPLDESTELLEEAIKYLVDANKHMVEATKPLEKANKIFKDATKYRYSYWLCLQPRCDCVRIKNKREFIFIPLKKLKNIEANTIFNVIIEDKSSEFSKLKIISDNYEAVKLEFSSHGSPEEVIRSFEEKGDFYFKTSDSAIKFKWIAELKDDHAQRIANNFAAQISRVGLDESEWLRRWALPKC
jgi:exonuclease VII small subunit